MEEQDGGIFSERTISEEEEFYDYTEYNEDWENIIINPDESASQVSQLNSEISSLNLENSTWNYYNRNPPDAQGFNICKICSMKYSITTSITTLQGHLEKHHDIKIPTKKHKVIVEKKNPFSKEEQKKHDDYLIQWLICDLQPFSVVDNDHFRKFISFFCPRYIIPDRHKIKGKINLNN